MNTKEVSEKFNVDLDILEYYENIGLLDDVKRIDGIRKYENSDIERLSKIVTLKKIGLNISEISRYLDFINKGELGENERITILKRHRQVLLDDVHEKQKSIDCIDCIIYEIQGCSCNGKERKSKFK